jgi:myosin V
MADNKKRRSSIASFNRSQSIAIDVWDRAAVWVTRSFDPVSWEKGHVSSRSQLNEEERKFKIHLSDTDQTIEVLTTALDKQNLEFAAVKRRDISLNGTDVDDMTSLLFMNEPELLECVQQRYMKKSIYTSIGPILLAINPFERLPIYDDDTLVSYHTEGVTHRLTHPPHVFHVSNRAYNNMFVDKFRPEERENQAILVNGESGAGKTESTKHVLHFLAVISSKVASQIQVSDDMNTEIENQILASNPILESFGNAKTTRNNNSSRFGKFIELLYASDGYIEGAVMRTYLLETMRVATQGKLERNYHVFYQVHAGLDKYSRDEFGLTELSNYNYTNQSGEYNRLDGESDLDNFAEMKDAFTTLGIDDDLQTEVDRVIVAILHLGNLTFTDSSKAGEDAAEFASTPANTSTVNYICGLLAVRKETLLTAVGRRSVTVVGNTIEKTLNSEAAVHARDSLAKFLYSSLFTWVVAKINACLTGKIVPDQSASFIGVLDIFGFEHFAKNSFEQLCINYTNEKLQDHFNYSVFKSEQEVYKQEGLKWTFIAYPDNSARLDLLEHSTNGILSVCNEQLKLPKSTDEKLASALYQKCGSHPFFRATRPEMGRHEFTILHYACPVTYQTQGFLDKNRTENPKELYELLAHSTNPLLTEMTPPEYRVDPFASSPSKGSLKNSLTRGPSFRGNLQRAPSQRFNKFSRTSTVDSANTSDAAATQKTRSNRGTTIGKKVSSLAVQFQSQLTELISKIRSTRSHFICCVKPNNQMAPLKFETKMCTDQLRCSGSLGAIQVFKAGFANRFSFAAFTARFAAFGFVAGDNPLTTEFKQSLKHARATGLSDHWRKAAGRLLEIVPLSHTVLALVHNESPECEVDFNVDMQMGYSQIFLKAAAFEFLEKLHLRTRNLTARRLQLRWRAWRVTKHVDSNIKTTTGMFRAQEAMRYFSDFRRMAAIKQVSATLLLQRRARVFLAVKYRKWMIKQMSRFQKSVRRFLEKKRLERLRQKSARVLQRSFQSLVIRLQYLRYRHSVISLQSCFRSKRSREALKRKRLAEQRGLWSLICLQAIQRGNSARMKYFALKRAAVSSQLCPLGFDSFPPPPSADRQEIRRSVAKRTEKV